MIERDLLQEIRKWLNKDKIIILKGARQVGKTTLLSMLIEELTQKGEKIKSFACDQELTNPIFSDHKLFVQYIKDQLPSEGRLYIFLDEFQYIENAGLFLKTVFDQLKSRIQLIVSGSSSLEITHNSEFLTGRKVEFLLSSLTFTEFAHYKSEDKLPDNISNINELNDFHQIYGNTLQSLCREYLNYGGYPEIAITPEHDMKLTLLKDIVTTYIEKDIAGFLRVQNTRAFNYLVEILCHQIGNLVNKSELSQTIAINYETLGHYLAMLEGTYVFDLVVPFSRNIRKELTKMPKIFVNDLGIYKIKSKPENLPAYQSLTDGALAENFVYLWLKNKYGQDAIHFYRTKSKAEIDFIVEYENHLLPIEVKLQSKYTKTSPKAMSIFTTEYNTGNLWKVLCTKDTLYIDKGKNFLAIPIYLLPFFDVTKLYE